MSATDAAKATPAAAMSGMVNGEAAEARTEEAMNAQTSPKMAATSSLTIFMTFPLRERIDMQPNA